MLGSGSQQGLPVSDCASNFGRLEQIAVISNWPGNRISAIVEDHEEVHLGSAIGDFFGREFPSRSAML